MTTTVRESNIPSDVLWEWLKSVAQFLGIVGGGGSGFAALAFGIGYLATKAHDAMLGLPTTTANYGVYVRTGALFVPRTIMDTALVLAQPAALGLAFGAPLLIGLLASLHNSPASGNPSKSRFSLSGRARPFFLALLTLGLMLVALNTLSYHVEPLHHRNTNLLFQRLAPERASDPPLTVALRTDDTMWLHGRYGRQCAELLALAVGIYALRRWRRRFNATGESSPWIGVVDYFALPGLLVALTAFVVTIPSIYGVLAVPPTPCVQPIVADTTGKETKRKFGLLWSDLTADTTQIVILEKAPYGYAHQFYSRPLVHRIETIKCRLLESSEPRKEQGRRDRR